MQCRDCYFFTHASAVSRKPTTCAELGEQEEAPACNSFRPRDQVPEPLAPTEVQLDPDKPVNFSYANAMERLLKEQFQIERDIEHALNKVQSEFYIEQVPATLSNTKRYVENMLDLRFLAVLVGHFECSVYLDVIMAAEIERLWGVKPHKETVESILRSFKAHNDSGLLHVPDDDK